MSLPNCTSLLHYFITAIVNHLIEWNYIYFRKNPCKVYSFSQFLRVQLNVYILKSTVKLSDFIHYEVHARLIVYDKEPACMANNKI